MPGPTKAKLFMHGGSQAVRLPKAFRFEGTEVLIRKDGDAVVIEPPRKDFNALWAKLDAIGAGDALPDGAYCREVSGFDDE